MRRSTQLVILVFLAPLIISGCQQIRLNEDTLLQTSTISALLEGVYDGETTYGELKKYGDFGIGTFNGLDGEMIGLEGEFYQVKADGSVYTVNNSMKTPFAVITYFESDKSSQLHENLTREQLEDYLDNFLPTENIFYAIKVEGNFDYIRVRSVHRQKKPYPLLIEAVKDQPVFEFNNVKGTIVGFKCPEYIEGINVPGYHFHFISWDKTVGGHLLDCKLDEVKIDIDYTSSFYMILPEGGKFYKVDLSNKKEDQLKRIESDRK